MLYERRNQPVEHNRQPSYKAKKHLEIASQCNSTGLKITLMNISVKIFLWYFLQKISTG